MVSGKPRPPRERRNKSTIRSTFADGRKVVTELPRMRDEQIALLDAVVLALACGQRVFVRVSHDGGTLGELVCQAEQHDAEWRRS